MTKLEKSCYFVEDRISVSEISKKGYVSTENMLQNKAGICEATNLPSVEYTSSFQKNDILVSNIRPYFKKIWYAKFSGGCSNDVLVFRARRGFDSRFLYYVLSDDTFFNYVMSSAKGTKMPRGDKTAIMNYSVPDFDIEIQRKIAGILGALDDKIEVLREQNKTLEQMAQAVFQSWFVDFDIVRAKAAGLPAADVCKKYHITPDIYDLFPSAFSADNLPQGWTIGKIEEIAEQIICGKTPPTANKEYYGKDIPFITIPDMHNNVYIIKTERCLSKKGADSQSNKTLPFNSICVSCIGTAGLVSLVAVESQTNQQINSIIPLKNICPYYVFLSMQNLSEIIQSLGRGGSTISNLNKAVFSNINILIPSQKCLDKFHMLIGIFFEKITENSKQIRTLEQTRDTLLPQLISGKLDVENMSLSVLDNRV